MNPDKIGVASWQRALLVSSALGLALLGGCGPRNGATNNASDTVASAPAGGDIPAGTKTDAQASEVWKQAVATYAGLKSYSSQFEFKTGSVRLQGDVAWARPNRMRVALKFAKGTSLGVSDGQTLHGSSTAAPGIYVQAAAPPDLQAVEAGFERRGMLMGFSLDPMLIGKNPLDMFVSKPQSVTLGASDTISGVAVDTVKIELGPEQPITLSYAIGRQDHLLYRITASDPGNPQTPKFTNTFSAIKTDQPLAATTLSFTPPAKAEALDSLLPQEFDRHLIVGKNPFPFQAKDLTGKTVSLDQYKGKVVLLDFWATWCGPCMAEMPSVIAAYKKFDRRDFEIIGVSLDQSHSDLTGFLKTQQMPWRQVWDGHGWKGSVPRLYGLSAIPFTLLIGRDGRIAGVNLQGDELEGAVQRAIAQQG